MSAPLAGSTVEILLTSVCSPLTVKPARKCVGIVEAIGTVALDAAGDALAVDVGGLPIE